MTDQRQTPDRRKEWMEHIERQPIVRDALRDIMLIVCEGARGKCGCGDLRECGRCQWLDSASDRIEGVIGAALVREAERVGAKIAGVRKC